MQTKTRHEFRPCVPGALDGGLVRTAYYDGMVLSESDMLREQSYWRAKRRLTNRALGQGVVWGLTLRWDAKGRLFHLGPGYGLSCCGDDLVVECPGCIPEGELVDPCGEDFRRLMAHAAATDPCDPCAKPDGPTEACVLLEYVECPEDPRQVFEDPCAERVHGCRYGAVRETTRLRLVPPPPAPPGTMEAFCGKIDEIRAKLDPAALVDPIFAMDTRSLRLVAAYLDGTTDAVLHGAQADLELAAAATATMDLATPGTGNKLRIGLEPPPGYVFTRADVAGAALGAADAWMGAFTTFASVPAVSTTVIFHAEVSPLFGAGSVHDVQVAVTFTPATTGGAGTPPRLSAVLNEYAVHPARHDCSSLLAGNLLFAGSADCTLRTLMLAVLCGWFKGALFDAPCAPPKDAGAPVDPSRLLLAWVVCRIAWRALFGIDIAAARDAGLEKCLHQLLRAWCEGFHYKGPRCDCHAHGIILGCLQISPKGRILCFDEWTHRRYVLTGPLLTHWAAQFGLAPIDVAIGRLARWVCCVAAAPLPELSAGVTIPDPSVLALGGGAFAAGRAFAVGDRYNDARVDSVRALNGMEFVGRVLDMLFSPDPASLHAATTLRVYTAPGGSLQLLVPASGALRPFAAAPGAEPIGAGGAGGGSLLGEIRMAATNLQAMVRQPLADFVDALGESIQLDQLRPRADARLFGAMVESLQKAGVASAADLMRAGPESALARVRASVSADDPFADLRTAEKTVALVHDAATRALGSAVEAVAALAAKAEEEDPFTRADLEEAATLGAVRKAVNAHLRERSTLGADALKRVAARAVAMRP